MKIILMEDHPRLGKTGSVVEVAAGYARNYMLPRGKALPNTEHNRRLMEGVKTKRLAEEARRHEAALELAAKLSGVSLTITMAAGEEDKLFGSVTSGDIAEALAAEGYEFDRKQVVLEEPIKKLGIFPVPVKLSPEVTAEVKLWVVKE
jgi:large subunit ribosomal protein L9